MLLILIPQSKQYIANLVVFCDAFADFARLDLFLIPLHIVFPVA